MEKGSAPPFHSEMIDSPQHPLQMPVRHPRLELGLHVPAQVRLRPHESALVMLHAHRPLRSVHAAVPVGVEHGLVLQIELLNHDRRGGLRLEPELAVPGHVLDGEQGAVGDDDHVEVPVGDEHPVRGFDDLWQHVLDRVRGQVAFAFGAAVVIPVYF